MTLPVVIPNEFANATASIPLSQLDSNFSTLANVVNEINAGTQQLSNANVVTLIVTGNATIGDASSDTVTLNSTLTANTAVIFSAGTSAAPAITTTGDTNTGIFFPAADTIAFAEGGAERARIDSSGRLLINATAVTAGYTGVNHALIVGGHSSPGIKLQSTTGPNAWDLYVASGVTFYFAYNSSDKATINSSTGVYTAISDANKKKDFEDSTIGLEAVMQLQPKFFRMIEDADDAPKQLGFVAQDVKDLIPQAYTEQENGNGTFIGLQDRPIIAALTKAIQELKAELDTVKAELATLKG